MNTLKFGISTLFIFLTVGEPALAQSSTASMEDIKIERLSDLGMSINPQLGVSSFDYSKGSKEEANSKFSGGVTVEFGKEIRKLETGLLALQTASSTYLTIPMMAKIRLARMGVQSWYGKFGFQPAFEISSNKNSETNNIDVIGALGTGGRFEFNKKSDFIIEATYNRGIMDALRSAKGDNLNQGFLVLAGMSFNI